jgi:stage II sporulation protein P
MLVVGSDAGGQTHDNWRSNLSLAVGLQQAVQEEYGTLIRPIVLRSSRFNQHLSTGALLVEVGSHGNTLQEAITAARLFAQAAAETLQ